MESSAAGESGGRIWHRDGDKAKVRSVPAPLRGPLAPAEWIVSEWTPYVVEWLGATALRIGSLRLPPLVPGVFALAFENQLGLATVQGEDAHGSLGPPLHLEVIAAKFTQPEHSIDFLRSTLTDLFARVAASPFILSAATERMVRESHAPPCALFAFHFFRRHGAELVHALQAVLGRPHRRLAADPELVRPHEVRQIERESIIRALRASHPVPVDPAARDAPMTPLQRLRPERIWQQLPIETHDTPENRFVLTACRGMLGAIVALRRAFWYQTSVDARMRVPIDHAAEHLAMLTLDDRFARLGPLTVAPAQSRVLQRRDGYREIAQLWQRFQRSRQPVFERMQQAIDLRNIADLYEYWVWFELIDRIQAITGATPAHLPVLDDFGVPGWRSRVRFGEHGTLHYNRTFRGYSGIWLRPDFVWERPDGTFVVMDAKFRMQQPTELIDEASGDIAVLDDQQAKADDLAKMHVYRDAIRGVRAAIVLYPGIVPVFRDVAGHGHDIGLAELLSEGWEGIGAFPFSPIALSSDEERSE